MAVDDSENVAFLSGAPKYRREFSRYVPHSWRSNPRTKIIGVCIAVICLLTLIISSFGESTYKYFLRLGQNPDRPRLHVLIPATKEDVNLCKTTLSLSVLEYPDPTLVGWQETYNTPDQQQGGALIATKITKVLEYINNLDPYMHDDDLILVVDPDDIWFQLRPNVLIDRWRNINRLANGRLVRRLGRRAIEREGIEQKIVMGARKSCSPNQKQSVACYPVPVSGIVRPLYGQNTDMLQGKYDHKHFRPRYPDSGFIMGPLKNMRPFFEYAQNLVDTMDQHPKWDNGSHTSDNLYNGDPQAIFSIIFGEQEFQREVIRKRHRSWFHKVSVEHMPGSIEDKKYKDIIKPDFTHQKMEEMKGHPREFGIGLDYWSELGHTVDESERDAKFLVYSKPEGLEAQIKNRNIYDCKLDLPKAVPRIIRVSGSPFALESAEYGETTDLNTQTDGKTWGDVPLYTQVCTRSIPVMIHNNGNQELLEKNWPKMWFQSRAKDLLHLTGSGPPPDAEASETFDDHAYGKTIDDQSYHGMWTDKRDYLSWSKLCATNQFQQEIFRDS